MLPQTADVLLDPKYFDRRFVCQRPFFEWKATMSTRPILIRGEWKSSSGTSTFQSYNPSSSQPLADEYPLSPWEDIEAAITSAADAARAMRGWPGTRKKKKKRIERHGKRKRKKRKKKKVKEKKQKEKKRK